MLNIYIQRYGNDRHAPSHFPKTWWLVKWPFLSPSFLRRVAAHNASLGLGPDSVFYNQDRYRCLVVPSLLDLLFFFLSVLHLRICNSSGYDRPYASVHYTIKPGSIPFISCIFALPSRYDLVRLWEVSPSWSFFSSHSHSLSLAPSLSPITVVFKILVMVPSLLII